MLLGKEEKERKEERWKGKTREGFGNWCHFIWRGRGAFCRESVRSVSTPGADVHWPRLSSGINAPPPLEKELCPGKGVTSAAEIAPPHISARTRLERWWKERRGAKDKQSLLFNQIYIYIYQRILQSFSFFFLTDNSWNYTIG